MVTGHENSLEIFCNDEITKLSGICQKVVDEGYTITLPEHNTPGLLLKVVLGGVGWVGGGLK